MPAETTADPLVELAEFERIADVAESLADLCEQYGWRIEPEPDSFADEALDRLRSAPFGALIEPAAWEVLCSMTSGNAPSKIRRDARALRKVLALAREEAGADAR